MTLFKLLLLFFIYSHFLVSKILSEFVTVNPFSFYNITFSRREKYYAHYTPKNSQSKSTIFLKENTNEVLLNIYDSEDLSNKIQSFKIISTEKTEYELNASPTGDYFFTFECSYYTSSNILFNILNYGDYIKTLKKNEDVTLEGYSTTDYLYFQYERELLESFTITISKRKHQYFIYYEVINLNTNELKQKSLNDNDISLYIDEFVTDKHTYLLIIHADVDEIPEKNNLTIVPHPFNLTKIETGKKTIQEIAEYNKLYFKYDLSDYPNGQDNLGMFGFDYYNNTEVVYSAPDVLCSVVVVKENSDYQLLQGFENSTNCGLLKYDKNNTNKYYITFTKPTEIPQNYTVFLVIVDTITIESNAARNYYSYFIPSIKSVSISTLSKYDTSLSPYSFEFLKFEIPEDFDTNVIFYTTNQKLIKVLYGSIIHSFKNDELFEPGKLYVYKAEQKEKVLYLHLNRITSEEAISLTIQRSKEKIEYKANKFYSNNYFDIDNCFAPRYFFYSGNSIENEQIHYEQHFGSFQVYYLNTESLDKEGNLIIFPALTELIEEKKSYPSNEIIMIKVTCKSPGKISFHFYDDLDAIMQFGKRYLNLHKRQKSYLHLSLYNKEGALYLKAPPSSNSSDCIKYDSYSLPAGEEVIKQSIYSAEDITFFATYNALATAAVILYKGSFDYFINERITWKTKDISDILYPNQTNLIYKFDSNSTLWTYLEVQVDNENLFYCHFGYYQGDYYYTSFYPIYQNTYYNKTSILYFRNPYLYSQIEDKDKFYFSLISMKDNFTSVQLIYHHTLALYGEDTTKYEVGELVLIGSDKLNYPFVMDDIDPGDPNFIYFVTKSCNSKRTQVQFSSIYNNDTEILEELSQKYSLFKISTTSYLQFGYVQNETLPYSGAEYSYLINPSENNQNTINSYVEAEKNALLFFDIKERKVSWNKIGNQQYELYYTKYSSENSKYLTNDCFLNEVKKSSFPDTKYIELTTEEFIFPSDEHGDYSINVVEVIRAPIELRLMRSPISISLRNYIMFDSEVKETSIELSTEAVYVVLNKREKWDYVEITISNPEYSSYYGYAKARDENYLLPPINRGDNVKEEGYVLYFANPYSEKETSIYYVSFAFTDKALVDTPQRKGFITVHYISSPIEKKISEDYPNLFYSVESSPNNDRYQIEQNNISINEKNNITVFLKVCSLQSMTNLTFYSGIEPSIAIEDFDSYLNYHSFSFITLLNVSVSFPKSADEKYGGFISYINANMSEDEINSIKEFSDLVCNGVTYDNETFTLSWEQTPNADFYEIFLVKYKEELSDYKDNDCLYLSRKHNSEYNDTIIYNTTDTSIEIKENGTFIVKIFAIKKEPGYFRVGYKSEVIDKAFYPVENVENTIDININHVMFPFSTKQWEYLNIRITSPEFKYKIILPNLSYEKSGEFLLVYPNVRFPIYNKVSISILFTDIPTVSEPTKKAVIFFNYYTLNLNEIISSVGHFYYYYSYSKLRSTITRNIEQEKENKVALAVKGCRNSYPFQIYKGNVLEKSIKLNDFYNIITFTTLSYPIIHYNPFYDSGFIFSYSTNVSEDYLKKLNSLLSYQEQLGEVEYDYLNRTFSWKHFEEMNYTIYIYNGDKGKLTDCKLIDAERGSLNIQVIKREKPYYTLKEMPYPVVSFVVVGIIDGEIPLRFNYPILQTNVPLILNTELWDERYYHSINSKQFIFMLPLNTDKEWDYIDFTVESSFNYSIGFFEFETYQTFTFSNDFYKTRSQTFTFQNLKKKQYYISILFDNYANPDTAAGKVSYKLIKMENPTSNILYPDTKGIYFPKKNEEFKINSNITVNYNNTLTLLVKSCKSNDEKMTIQSGGGYLFYSSINEDYYFKTFNTYTDLNCKVESKNGVFFTIETNLTDKKIEQIKEIIDTNRGGKVYFEDDKIIWNSTQETKGPDYPHYYEVYFNVTKYLFSYYPNENECDLYNFVNKKEKRLAKTSVNITMVKTNNREIPYIVDDFYSVTVVKVITEPVLLRFRYETNYNNRYKAHTVKILIIGICVTVVIILLIYFGSYWLRKKDNKSNKIEKIKKDLEDNKEDLPLVVNYNE